LKGSGLEIGPLHAPFPLPPGVAVIYVDRVDYDGLLAQFADDDNVRTEDIVKPDVVSDATTLAGIADASVDFVVASHVIEHLPNPIEALCNWRRVLRTGGLLVCLVPDARYTFDLGRPLTSYEHLFWDYVNEGTDLKRLSDVFHIAECVLNMGGAASVNDAVEIGRVAVDQDPNVHYHVWDYVSFDEHIRRLIASGLGFEIVQQGCDDVVEMLFLLRAKPAAARPLLEPPVSSS